MKTQQRLMILCSLLTGACASMNKPDVRGSHVRLLKADPAQPKVDPKTVSGTNVEVFYKKDITRPHTEIGIVEAVAKGANAGLADLLPELQKQAAILNAKAIKKIEIQRYDHEGAAIHGTAIAVGY